MTPTQDDREAALAATGWKRWEDACIALSEMEMAELAEAFMRHRLAAEERGARTALEAAADWVDGKGGQVIPGATVFVPVVTGDNQPCMSGDMRDRLPSHKRRAFDDAMRTLSTAIRQIDPAALGAE